MAKAPHIRNVSDSRYEFRVWGEYPKALEKLELLSSDESLEEIEDCYLLIDDPEVNAKVRRQSLKVKHLVSVDLGYERWATEWHQDANTAPTPLDELIEELLDRAGSEKQFDRKALEAMELDGDTRTVFVSKQRRHFRVGAVKAEVTRIDVRGRKGSLHSFAIESEDVGELDALRRKLGFKRRQNQPIHVKLEQLAS